MNFLIIQLSSHSTIPPAPIIYISENRTTTFYLFIKPKFYKTKTMSLMKYIRIIGDTKMKKMKKVDNLIEKAVLGNKRKKEIRLVKELKEVREDIVELEAIIKGGGE